MAISDWLILSLQGLFLSILSRDALAELSAMALSHFCWWISQFSLDGLLVIQSGSLLDKHFLGSFCFLLFKNKVGEVPALSGKTLHFLIVAKEPKVKVDCMGMVRPAGSHEIKS